MKILFLLASVGLASASVLDIRNSKCKDVVIDGYNYAKEVLKRNVNTPYQLAVNYNTNFLFFSYTNDNSKEFDGINVAAYIDLNTNEFGIIDGVIGGFANAFDPESHRVLIGATDGIYVFDYETKSGLKTNITDNNIWQIFARDGIYFTVFPDELAYVYKHGEVNKVAGIGDKNVMQIGVDSANNIFFYNDTGLFCSLNDSGETLYLGYYVVVGFTMDVNGALYFATPTGIYSIKSPFEIVKITRIVGIYGMAITGDGSIIYAASNAVIRLKPTGIKCRNS